MTNGYPRVITYPMFSELNNILSQFFEVISSSLEYGMPTFVCKFVADVPDDNPELDNAFNIIAEKSKELNVWPVINWYSKPQRTYFIRFVPRQDEEKSDVTINIALFIATLAAVSIGGLLQATSPVFLTLFYPNGYTLLDVAWTTFLFVVSLMGIIGTHEFGHYMAAKKRGVDATLPYFIPGLPQIGGTFGAFIKQKSPPMKRSDLFDIGVAGPLAGFAVTVIVLIVGFLMSVPVTAEELDAIDKAFPGMTGSLPVPLLFSFVEYLFHGFIPSGGTLYLHPIAFASWVGMLVTALNLFPTGQLDGGHALRAIVSPKAHKNIGWIAIIIMFLMQLWLMAFLVLALSAGGDHPGALNETIPVSRWRVVLFIICMIILILCMPPLWAFETF